MDWADERNIGLGGRGGQSGGRHGLADWANGADSIILDGAD